MKTIKLITKLFTRGTREVHREIETALNVPETLSECVSEWFDGDEQRVLNAIMASSTVDYRNTCVKPLLKLDGNKRLSAQQIISKCDADWTPNRANKRGLSSAEKTVKAIDKLSSAEKEALLEMMIAQRDDDNEHKEQQYAAD